MEIKDKYAICYAIMLQCAFDNVYEEKDIEISIEKTTHTYNRFHAVLKAQKDDYMNSDIKAFIQIKEDYATMIFVDFYSCAGECDMKLYTLINGDNFVCDDATGEIVYRL